jgi:hypothetical protein
MTDSYNHQQGVENPLICGVKGDAKGALTQQVSTAIKL